MSAVRATENPSVDDCVQVEGGFASVLSMPTSTTSERLTFMKDGQIKNTMVISGTYMGGYHTNILLGDYTSGLPDMSTAIPISKGIVARE